MHGGAGIGIHDGGEWQLKVGSWELDRGRKVLWEEGRRDGKSRRRKNEGEDFWQERILGERRFFLRSAELFWLVTDYSSTVLATRRRLTPEFGKNRIE